MSVWESLVRHEALGRVDTLTAVLAMTPQPGDDDIAWATVAVASLASLCARLRVDAAAAERELSALRDASPDARVAGSDRFLDALGVVRAALVQVRAAAIPERVKLDEIADSARAEVERLASELGVPVVADIAVRAGPPVSRDVAGGVIDAIGLTLGHMARHGCVRGGSVRIEIRRDGDDVAVTLGDRGNADSREAGAGEEDSTRLAAASGRLVAIGGSLAVSDAPWGGTSVVVRVPDRTGLGQADVRRRG